MSHDQNHLPSFLNCERVAATLFAGCPPFFLSRLHDKNGDCGLVTLSSYVTLAFLEHIHWAMTPHVTNRAECWVRLC